MASDSRRPRRPRPLAHHLKISLATSAFLLTAFLLFLLVGISLPIIKSVYILSIQFIPVPNQPITSTATELRFGVWGLCALSQDGTTTCFGPMLGYTIPQDIIALTGFPTIVDALDTSVTVILVLHLVAAALAFIGVFASLFLESHPLCILSLVTTVFTLIVGLVVLAIDLVLVLVGKARIGQSIGINYTVNWGPAVWMVLPAVIITLIGMILMSVVVCECCGVRRAHRHRHHSQIEEQKKP